MERGYGFSSDLLQMMLSEERQKFVSALGRGASWWELKRIRKNIIQINDLLDSLKRDQRGESQGRFDNQNPRQ
jgi:hypothetical protein